ncbi:unnamed protein product [Schistosoma curassoni]|uniref:SCP domain-containing protein n=1 Tax=Schistosoma curassoni TaxID=6186 RepID=A0A183JWU6_9TREM|nr:unnamed protein product [Schistosoma curassoni]
MKDHAKLSVIHMIYDKNSSQYNGFLLFLTEKHSYFVSSRYCESGYYYTAIGNNSIFCRQSMCKRDVMCGRVKIPDQYVGECYQEYYNRLHRTYNNGSGIPSAGYILLVDAINTHTCSGSTAAFASSCLMDEETDR